MLIRFIRAKNAVIFLVYRVHSTNWPRFKGHFLVHFSCKRLISLAWISRKPSLILATTSCKDNHVFCGVLRSYCSDVWVLLNCKKACGKCPKPTQKQTPKPTPRSTCQDKRKHCAYWNGRGYCRGGRFEGFMRRNCQKSCGFCRK